VEITEGGAGREDSFNGPLKMSLNKWTRPGLAVVSGLALAAAFPKFDLNLFAWVAFIHLLYSIQRHTLWRVFAYAWLQGFVCFVG